MNTKDKNKKMKGGKYEYNNMSNRFCSTSIINIDNVMVYMDHLQEH